MDRPQLDTDTDTDPELETGFVRRKLIPAAGAAVLRAISWTIRWERFNAPVFANGPYIHTFWHSRLLMMLFCYGHRVDITALSSKHRDGLLFADTLGRLGISSVLGSSTRGGLSGARELGRILKAKRSVAITPDGPKGPRGVVKEGVIAVAQLSGCPILPMGYYTSNARELGSWDRLLVPRLFKRGVFVFGEPYTVPARMSETERREQCAILAEKLNAADAEARRICEADESARDICEEGEGAR